MRIWDKDKVLADLVYAIRYFKPDIIVNRFDHRTPGKTHGHHTSSAMLSVEAFDLAGDPQAYPEQLKEVDVWQPTRQFMNTSWWFYGSRENFAKADKTYLIAVDAGVYYPTLGKSNSEYSALARSKHRSQGFGSSGNRGSYQEYLELINGEMPKDKENLFEGVDTGWNRIKGGNAILPLAQKLEGTYDFRDPSLSLGLLLDIKSKLSSLANSHYKDLKMSQVDNLIMQCAGLWIEASISTEQVARGDSLEIQIEMTNRSSAKVRPKDMKINGESFSLFEELEPYTENKDYKSIRVSDSAPYRNPYWLDEAGALGVYKVSNMADRIKPQSDPALVMEVTMDVEGQELMVRREIIQRYVDPAIGEIRRPISIVPAATMRFDKDLYLFADDDAQELTVNVRSGTDELRGKVSLDVPRGWKVSPESYDVEIDLKGFEGSYNFKLMPPQNQSEGEIKAKFRSSEGKTYDQSLTRIDYGHIPIQMVLAPSTAKLVKVPLKKEVTNIGYVMGAGDKVNASLAEVGYEVSLIEPSALATADLSGYDAIVIGIRAYNKIKDLKLYNQFLFDYAEQGGTLITQYNTSRRLNFKDLSPYHLKLSRKRVTDEYAEMRILQPEHRVFNMPNKISSRDFEGWVQERGLYFAEEWGEEFTPMLSSNDKGEDPLDGSLLVATHGDGHVVYTSISWFRQLPAGVAGAYRLFANLLALGHEGE